MHHDNPETLAHLLGSPLCRQAKVNISARALANLLITLVKGESPKEPDSEAVRFYGLNQMVSIVRSKFTPNETLPSWARGVTKAYEEELKCQHRRMLHYIFLITSREWRHLPSGQNSAIFAKMDPGMKIMFPLISDTTSDANLNKWLAKAPDIDIEKYMADLTLQFDQGGYSGGFGGKKWGQVSRTLGQYLAGKTTAEVMIDTAYTLAHNNGPIFNKGMQYTMYTSHFKKLLDVQRSGQICEGLLSGEISTLGTQNISDVADLAKLVRAEVGVLGEYIDWYAVEKLGSLAQYSTEKAQQDKKYGKKALKTLLAGKPVKITGLFETYPGETVQIYQRLAA